MQYQFSLDRKRRSHERNRYSASDSDSLIFTRSYRSTSASDASENQPLVNAVVKLTTFLSTTATVSAAALHLLRSAKTTATATPQSKNIIG